MRSFIGLDLSIHDKLSLEHWREKSLPAFRPAIANRSSVSARQPKPVPAANFHVTLCFLGTINHRQHDALVANLNEVHASPVEATLNLTAYWHGPKILLAAPADPPSNLRVLASDVTNAARNAGIPVERRDYQPHVTLVRNVKENFPAPLFAPELTCQFSQFHLFESTSTPSGVRYPIRHSWSMHGSKSIRENLQSGHF